MFAVLISKLDSNKMRLFEAKHSKGIVNIKNVEIPWMLMLILVNYAHDYRSNHLSS